MMNPCFAEIDLQIMKMAERCQKNYKINTELYDEYGVKRGLRDKQGRGVLTGLTEISEVTSYSVVDMDMVPCPGQLYYQGVNVEDLVKGFQKENRFGFEETAYLLLLGKLPTSQELTDFNKLLAKYRELPTTFVRDIILKAPSQNMMNTLARSVLTLYSYDEKADDTSIANVLRQSLELIALFPLLSVYGYQAYSHYHDGKSLFIISPQPELSTAENILHILRQDGQFTQLEAQILDVALVLHAEHGGGNNSTFTTHVVTSTGTDTYAAIAAALSSLKGGKHGGANLKVMEMFEDLKRHVTDWENEDEVRGYLQDLLDKKAFDKAGLIYGIGHAVYTLSDPRAEILKVYVQRLSEAKGLTKEWALYNMVERLAPELVTAGRKTYKAVCANIDFYSGFVYKMLGLPMELYTPIFAIARIVGWSAHRIEELVNAGKIIRPAYKSIAQHKMYQSLAEREAETSPRS